MSSNPRLLFVLKTMKLEPDDEYFHGFSLVATDAMSAESLPLREGESDLCPLRPAKFCPGSSGVSPFTMNRSAQKNSRYNCCIGKAYRRHHSTYLMKSSAAVKARLQRSRGTAPGRGRGVFHTSKTRCYDGR